MLIDFDRFKNINDTLGHDVGDQLLRECAKILKSTISINDRVYRMGGDEFIVIIQNIPNINCTSVAETILNRFSKPIQVFNYQISITPSIGISFYPDNGETSEILLKNADTSMYLAKSKGRNQFSIYSEELNHMMQRKMQLEKDISLAIHNGSLFLHYQPKVKLQTKEIVGFEALLRWRHPTLGFISPDEFIPIAEDTGQIVQIGDWVLKIACRQLKKLQQKGYENLVMCVNVSVKQFQHKEFLSNVKKIIEQTGVEPTDIILEITESIIKNLVDSKRIIQELKTFGIKTSLDDFGTGYSSLSVLKTLPIDAIKIDKTFIKNNTDKDRAILKTIMDLGYNLNLHVVIEGIESEEQVMPLLEFSNSNTFGQGFLFSKPVPPHMLESLLEKKTL